MNRKERIAALMASLDERILILDGVMGTMIQGYGLEEADYRGERFRDHALRALAVNTCHRGADWGCLAASGVPCGWIQRGSWLTSPPKTRLRGVAASQTYLRPRLLPLAPAPPTLAPCPARTAFNPHRRSSRIPRGGLSWAIVASCTTNMA